MTELEDPRTVERLRLDSPPPSLSAWQRYSPCDVRGDSILTAIRDYLDEPATRRQFDAHEQSEIYPLGILKRLGELGLSEIFSTTGGSGRATAYHMCALNELAARRDTSVAVTLSVNVLGLLPAYLAADADQLEAIDQRILVEGFCRGLTQVFKLSFRVFCEFMFRKFIKEFTVQLFSLDLILYCIHGAWWLQRLVMLPQDPRLPDGVLSARGARCPRRRS